VTGFGGRGEREKGGAGRRKEWKLFYSAVVVAVVAVVADRRSYSSGCYLLERRRWPPITVGS